VPGEVIPVTQLFGAHEATSGARTGKCWAVASGMRPPRLMRSVGRTKAVREDASVNVDQAGIRR
jgi:hypothetical protein